MGSQWELGHGIWLPSGLEAQGPGPLCTPVPQQSFQHKQLEDRNLGEATCRGDTLDLVGERVAMRTVNHRLAFLLLLLGGGWGEDSGSAEGP